eukprot:TRINITY_DN623_c0_g2_i10.p1 TRINITY_DN623_c0_g2~~TRINITY_DN623_c0_g2_i10.p1  ORF type:complete len:406 (+),score=27.96 TRINITY_DN623_c0_g2_i10:248-1465(+)
MDSDPANIASANTSTNTRKRKWETDFHLEINDLPSEVLLHILSYLHVDDICNYHIYLYQLIDISLVCRKWHGLSQEPSLWEYYPMYLDEEKFPEELGKLVNPKLNRIHSVYFTGTRTSPFSPHYAHIIFASQECSDCSAMVNQLSESERFNLTQIRKSIKTLDFTQYIVKKDLFEAICRLPKLKHLDIRLSTFQLEGSFHHITKLTALDYLGIDFAFDRTIYSGNLFSHLSELTNLTRLELTRLPLGENLSILSKLPKLRDLRILGPIMFPHIFLETLSTMTQIEALNLGYVLRNYEQTISKPLPNLRSMHLSANLSSQRFIPFLIPFLASLRDISFTGGRDTVLSREQISEMVRLAPRIDWVSVQCKGIKQDDLDELKEMFQGRVSFSNLTEGFEIVEEPWSRW